MAAEQRQVSNFDRVQMRGFGILHIAQGVPEALTIEADQELLEKVRSEVRDGVLILSIARDWLGWLGMGLSAAVSGAGLQYQLTVKELRGLAISGAGRVEVGALTTDRLAVNLSGGADVLLKSLAAEQLQVTLGGAGNIEVAGKVQEQEVRLTGAGRYAAKKLESQQARVRLSGAGSATVWAVQDLDVNLSGVGSVEYYGSPRVRKTKTGLGTIQHRG